MTYSVTVFAPDTDMPLAHDQVLDVIGNLQAGGVVVRRHTGHVSLPDFVRAMQVGPVDGVIFIAHGNELGMLLSDGLLLTANLVTHIRGNVRDFVFLNSCSSLLPAIELSFDAKDSRGDCPDIICTRLPLPDNVAYGTASRFAAELAKDHNPRRAFYEARPGQGREYVYQVGMSNAFLTSAA